MRITCDTNAEMMKLLKHGSRNDSGRDKEERGRKREKRKRNDKQGGKLAFMREAITSDTEGILRFCSFFFFFPSCLDWQRRYSRESTMRMQNHTGMTARAVPGEQQPTVITKLLLAIPTIALAENRVTKLWLLWHFCTYIYI